MRTIYNEILTREEYNIVANLINMLIKFKIANGYGSSHGRGGLRITSINTHLSNDSF